MAVDAESPGNKTIRCGVFKDLGAADGAVDQLLAAGFRPDQIDVVCSDKGKERHFSRVEHQPPAGRDTPEAAAGGGLAGLLVGGLISLGVTTATGLPLLAVGPSLLMGGAITGGLIGAMETRGHEGAAADFYDQALSAGDLLIAVDAAEEGLTPELQEQRMVVADQILRNAGAMPIPLTREI